MRTICQVFCVLFVALLAGPLWAQQPLSSPQIELLTPETGWALLDDRLYFTQTDGASWTDITPNTKVRGRQIDSVFFRDTSHAWVLLVENPFEEGPSFMLAATTDSGKSWVTKAVRLPVGRAAIQRLLTPYASVDFVNEKHGWLEVNIETTMNSSWGDLYETLDGGTSWHRAPGEPSVGGNLHFLSAKDGWFEGGPPGGLAFYTTHDGSLSWQEAKIAVPAQFSREDTSPVYYDVPVFESKSHGYLGVTYVRREAGSSVVMFETTDGGRSWKARSTASNVSGSNYIPCSVTRGHLRIPSNYYGDINVASYGADGKVLEKAASLPLDYSGNVEQVQFVNDTRGWLLLSGGGFGVLLTTRDGGESWHDISPLKRASLTKIPLLPGQVRTLPDKAILTPIAPKP